MISELGAKHIIDYTEQNLVDSNQKFDAILDAVGNISPEAAKNLLTKNGRAGLMVVGLGETLRAHGSVKTGTASEKKEDIEFLLSLVEQGKLRVIIDKTYGLNDIVAAHKHADTEQKVGNILFA